MKQTIDPDILAVLQAIGAGGEPPHVSRKKRKKAEQQLEDKITTQLELLTDEIERVIPKEHPLFTQVLLSVALRKVIRNAQEPEAEYHSALETFPNSW